MHDENKRDLKNIMYKTASVFLSGIGTIFLFQNEYLQNMVKEVVTSKKLNCDSWILGILTSLIGILIFVIINIIVWGIVKIKGANEDSKRNREIREDTAEYFHKVILNNIIMGLSFAKKTSKQLKMNESKDQCCFYVSQALFYLKTAIRELKGKNIFEAGERDVYIDFVNEVGWITLYETLQMLKSTFREIDNIIIVLSDTQKYSWGNEVFELNELKRQKKAIGEMNTITEWETRLLQVLEYINEKESEA